MKNKSLATGLAFFFGWFGVHRFYLRQWLLGFVYFLFAWTFIPLIVSMVDTIIWLSKSKEDWDKKYNKGKALEVKPVGTTISVPVAALQDEGIVSSYNVVGVKYHDYNKVKHFIQQGMKVTLEAEPTNPYDENAVKVMFGDKHLGYIPANDALEVSSNLEIYDAYRAHIKLFFPSAYADERICIEVKFWDN